MISLSYRDLTELSPEMGEQVRLWRNTPEVRSSMVRQHSISPEEHAQWLEFLRRHPHRQRVRVAFVDHDPFGVVTLKDLDLAAGVSDWGMYIGDPRFRGRGLGNALLFEILRWAFDETGLFRLFTSVLAANPQALVMSLRAGFELEGCWRRHVPLEGGDRGDLLWMAMLRPRWEERRKALEEALLAEVR